jgi:hypothetical protein
MMADLDDEKAAQQVAPDRPPRDEDAAHADKRSEAEDGRPKGRHDPTSGTD